jgi:hypothetical protein
VLYDKVAEHLGFIRYHKQFAIYPFDKGAVMLLTGGCFCGAVRYEADGTPFHETNCHCSICRRTTGAPFVAWFSVRPTEFRIVRGDPVRFKTTQKAVRAFCSTCGTQLTFAHADFPNEIDVTTSSLDDPELVPSRDNTRTSSRLRWIGANSLPDYPDGRSDPLSKV